MSVRSTRSLIGLLAVIFTFLCPQVAAQPDPQGADERRTVSARDFMSRAQRERLDAEDAADNLPFTTLPIKSSGRLGPETNEDIGLTHIIIDGSRKGIDPITCLHEEIGRFAKSYVIAFHRPYGFDNDNLHTDVAEEYTKYLYKTAEITAKDTKNEVAQVVLIEVRNIVGDPRAEDGFDVRLMGPWIDGVDNNLFHGQEHFDINGDELDYMPMLEVFVDARRVFSDLPGFGIFKDKNTGEMFIAKDETRPLREQALDIARDIGTLANAAERHYAQGGLGDSDSKPAHGEPD